MSPPNQRQVWTRIAVDQEQRANFCAQYTNFKTEEQQQGNDEQGRAAADERADKSDGESDEESDEESRNARLCRSLERVPLQSTGGLNLPSRYAMPAHTSSASEISTRMSDRSHRERAPDEYPAPGGSGVYDSISNRGLTDLAIRDGFTFDGQVAALTSERYQAVPMQQRAFASYLPGTMFYLPPPVRCTTASQLPASFGATEMARGGVEDQWYAQYRILEQEQFRRQFLGLDRPRQPLAGPGNGSGWRGAGVWPKQHYGAIEGDGMMGENAAWDEMKRGGW